MAIIVQKYGGSSVASVGKLQQVARKIVKTRNSGHDVVVVVSAMGKSTNQLLALAGEITQRPSMREMDMLLSTGERVSMALLCMALQELGHEAISLTGSQCSILTNTTHGNARILELRPFRVQDELARGRIVVVAGFQGVSYEREITTLGRGGSDTTAVALAAALGAAHCDIYSDVDGVYSADPRIVPDAQRIDELSYEEMQELARQGARVLNPQAVEFAKRKDIAIYARSTFGGDNNTVIHRIDKKPESTADHAVSGVTGREDLVRVQYERQSGMGPNTAEVLNALENLEILCGDADRQRIDVVLSTANIPNQAAFAANLAGELEGVQVRPGLGSVAAVGQGIGERTTSLNKAHTSLEQAGVPIITSFARSESVTCVVPADSVPRGVRAVHQAFIGQPSGVSAA